MGKRYMNLKKLFQDKSFSCCRARGHFPWRSSTHLPREKIFEPFKYKERKKNKTYIVIEMSLRPSLCFPFLTLETFSRPRNF